MSSVKTLISEIPETVKGKAYVEALNAKLSPENLVKSGTQKQAFCNNGK